MQKAALLPLAAVALVCVVVGQAVPQDGARPAKQAGAVPPFPVDKQVVFEFSDKKWGEVLEWLADQTGWPVVINVKPTGTFTYISPRDKNQKPIKYTMSRVVDLINEALALQDIVLVRKQASFATVQAGEKAVDGGWTSTFHIEKGELATTGRNPYFILEPGYQLVFEDGDERIVKTVLDETKVVDGVETRVVEERETRDGKLIEVSRNYFAISKRTNSVFYFGEDVDIYKDGKVVKHDGAWLAGVNGAKFGLVMPGLPLVKARYYHEVAPGTAMDRAEIVSVSETVKTSAGVFKNCVKTEETSPLEPTKDNKWYAPGVGQVRDGGAKLVKYGMVEKKANQ
ncbi:MAG: hypothetical protein U0746_07640 [Gemmataceae bacterium]